MIKEKIIIDCDPGIDDSLALLLAGVSNELEILGVTVVSGNIEVNQGSKNAYKALEMIKRSDIPIFKGEALPIKRDYVDATDTHGRDGLGETFYLVNDYKVSNENAIEFLLETIRKHPHEITVLALGPLTNIARAIEKDPTTMQLIKKIIIMGGAAKVNGNCSPVAEYNFWCDPEAAKIVFDSKLKNIYLVPLDVTYKILMTPNIREMINQFNTALANYVYAITRFYVNFHYQQEKTLGCVINDPLVVAYILDESIMRYQDATIDIETSGIAIGQSICDFRIKDKNRAIVHVCLDVDYKKFFLIFLKRLFKDQEKIIDLMIEKGYIL